MQSLRVHPFPLSQLGNLIRRISRLRPIMPRASDAARFLFALRSPDKRDREFEFCWRGLRFVARPQDFYGGVESVFLDEEYAILTDVLAALHRPVTILDAGANIGSFAIFVLAIRPDAVVHSIEADPRTFQLLQRNALAVVGKQWTVHEGALWSEDGEITFGGGDVSVGHRIQDGQHREGLNKVVAMRLDSLIERVMPDNRIALLKIDIEGAELAVLENSRAILEKTDHLIIETHPTLCSEAVVLAILGEYFPHIQSVGAETRDGSNNHVFFASRKAPSPPGFTLMSGDRLNDSESD
jgi:FkbM family methyltransferase